MTSINYPSYAENTNTDNFQVVGYNETTQAVERKNLGSAIDAKIVASSGAVQSAYQLIPQLIFKWFDDNNNPADGWLITSYEAGTTTPVDTYSDDVGTLNDNPITLNDRGEARIFLDSTLVYKFVITDALGGNVQTFDNITGVGGVSSGGGGSVAGNVGDLQLNKDGVNFGASGLNWSGGVLTINNSGTGSFTQDYSDLSKVTTTTAYGTGSVTQVVQSGAVSTTLTGSAGSLALVSDATRQSITMDNVSITSDAQSSFGLGVVLGGGLGLVNGSVDYTGGVFRFQENGVTRGFNANSITYDNGVSGLTATDVKSAIDELNTNANTLTMETITTSEINTALVAKPDGVGGVTWGTDSATPAGANTEIQFNDNGVFGANSDLAYDGTLKVNGSSTYAMEVTGGSVRGIFTEEGLESRGGLLLNIENSDIPLDIQNNTGGQIPTGMVMFGDYITGIDIDITGNGEAINARTNGGLYSITAYGGSLGSIYAENDIVTASNIEAVDGDFSGDIDVTGSITQEGELLWVKRGGDEDSYLRLTETDSYRGCYVSYDGLGNKMQLGTHDVVDELTANDVPFMEVARGSVDVDFLGDLDVTGSVTADSAHVAYGSLDTFGVGYLTLFNSESDGVNNLSRTYISSTDGPNNGNGSYSAWSSVGDTTFSGWIRNYLGTDVDSKFMIVGSGNAEVFSVDYFGNSDFLGDLDVTGSVITGSFASAPSSPTAGQIYFNTTTNKHQGYDGTTWNNLY